jgi:predicted dehydrogenase
LNVAIIGCGLIGHKRALALGPEHRVVVCADTDPTRARALADVLPGCKPSNDPSSAIAQTSVEAVFVCTSNDALAPFALHTIECGKHVLIEKPAARSAAELRPVVAELARQPGLVAKVGYNHRFHPGLARAYAIVQDGGIGEIRYIRGRYGHGGRPGYEREWRANPQLSGGGELLDQGCHLIDLTRWFMGDCMLRHSHLATYFWPMAVEDNAFLFLETSRGQVASLHASWTEWKNLFSFEIFGRTGKLQVDGLGGSYGTERLTYYRMLPEMGPPETTMWEFPGEDRSWQAEVQDFLNAIQAGRQTNGNLKDGVAALEIIAEAYSAVGLK